MIAYLSGVVSASAIGRSCAKLRNDPMRGFDMSSFFDWVIPPALAVAIVIAGEWIAFAPK